MEQTADYKVIYERAKELQEGEERTTLILGNIADWFNAEQDEYESYYNQFLDLVPAEHYKYIQQENIYALLYNDKISPANVRKICSAIDINRLMRHNQRHPIVIAVKNNNIQVIEAFLEGGLDPNANIAKDIPLIAYAIGQPSMPLFELLIRFNVDLKKKYKVIYNGNERQVSPMEYIELKIRSVSNGSTKNELINMYILAGVKLSKSS